MLHKPHRWGPGVRAKFKKPLGPEEDFAIDCADFLRCCALPDVFWVHLANEAQRSKSEWYRVKAMGFLSGLPDLVVTRERQLVGWVEFKSRKGNLSPDQKRFRDFCRDTGQPYEVVRPPLKNFIELCEWWKIVQ